MTDLTSTVSLPSQVVKQEVIDAVLAPETRVTRRAEIYESDGLTPWRPDLGANVKDGSVTVDYTRDERREFDLTLDNSDLAISLEAQAGLWYDKVLKVYRGVEYETKNTMPAVLVLEQDASTITAIQTMLRQIGLGSALSFVADPTTLTVNDLSKYDIIVVAHTTTPLSTYVSNLLVQAYTTGLAVFTATPASSNLDVPLIGTCTARIASGPLTMSQPASDTPFKTSWSPFKVTVNSGETVIQGLADNAQSAASVGLAQVPTNVAHTATVTSDIAGGTNRSDPSVVTNGSSVQSASPGNIFGENTTGGEIGSVRHHYAQIDLGGLYSVTQYQVAHFGGGRTYDRVLVEGSVDGTTWFTMYDTAANTTYQEPTSPILQNLPLVAPFTVRYVRDTLWAIDTYFGSMLWTEIQISGVPVVPTQYGAIFAQNTIGGKWFHYGVQLQNGNDVDSRNAQSFYRSVFQWLNPNGGVKRWETQVGEFVIDKLSTANFPHEIKVTGRDYTKRLKNYKFDVPVTFAAGQTLDTVIQAIAFLAGITKFNLGGNGVTLTTSAAFDRTDDAWSALSQMADSCNVELFFNPSGYLVSRPFRDPLTSPLSFYLTEGSPAGNLVTFTKSSDDSQIYNYVCVTGTNPADASSGTVYQSIAQNTNPTSPTSVPRIGRRSYYYTSSFFTTQAQCDAYAKRLLSILALESFEVDYTSLVYPWLEVGDIMQYEGDRYLMDSLTIPLGLAPMEGTSKKLTVIPND